MPHPPPQKRYCSWHSWVQNVCKATCAEHLGTCSQDQCAQIEFHQHLHGGIHQKYHYAGSHRDTGKADEWGWFHQQWFPNSFSMIAGTNGAIGSAEKAHFIRAVKPDLDFGTVRQPRFEYLKGHGPIGTITEWAMEVWKAWIEPDALECPSHFDLIKPAMQFIDNVAKNDNIDEIVTQGNDVVKVDFMTDAFIDNLPLPRWIKVIASATPLPLHLLPWQSN